MLLNPWRTSPTGLSSPNTISEPPALAPRCGSAPGLWSRRWRLTWLVSATSHSSATPRPSSGQPQRRRIAIGADHGGFEMKEALKKVLEDFACDYQDFGTHSTDPVDYPDFAEAVALAVARQTCDLGIMIDGAGIGSCMAANKIPGIRAAMCYDEDSARNSREHNGANVLTLGGKRISNAQMREIVRVWLSTDMTEERHRRRIAKIDALPRG